MYIYVYMCKYIYNYTCTYINHTYNPTFLDDSPNGNDANGAFGFSRGAQVCCHPAKVKMMPNITSTRSENVQKYSGLLF